jgi:hypothetical protein
VPAPRGVAQPRLRGRRGLGCFAPTTQTRSTPR